MPTIRPMLPAPAPQNLEALRYPLYASPKLSGIRCLIKDGQPVSSGLKPIPNPFVRKVLSDPKFEGLDGELIVGLPTDPKCFQHTTSGVMSSYGSPDFQYYVFDYWNRTTPFSSALDNLRLTCYNHEFITIQNQMRVDSAAHLETFEEVCIADGFSSIILRDPQSHYKFGKSTVKSQGMLELKRYTQGTAIVVGYEEHIHNKQPGLKRTRTDKLGSLVCQLLSPVKRTDIPDDSAPLTPTGPLFNIGTGFTEGERRLFWSDRSRLVGRVVTFKHFKQNGGSKAPKHPVFLSFRDAKAL